MSSTTNLPGNTCLIHGSYVGSACPTCSTGGNIPTQQTVGQRVTAPDHEQAEQIAQAFHETYERLAADFGYETRPESSVPWADVPENNRKLMVAVVAQVLPALAAQLADAQDKAERFSRPWLCDCHTWPDPDEAHGYIVAIETQLAEREREIEGWKRKVANFRDGLNRRDAATHSDNEASDGNLAVVPVYDEGIVWHVMRDDRHVATYDDDNGKPGKRICLADSEASSDGT